MATRAFKFDTLQLHAGQQADPANGSCAVPIYQTAAFKFKDFHSAELIASGKEPGFEYSRISNPTMDVLERRIAALEGGTAALAVASGAAAVSYAVMNIAQAGDEIVAAKSLYGGTYNLFTSTLPKFGVKTALVDPDDAGNFEKAITPDTKAIFVEVLGNPNMDVIDFEKVARIAEKHRIPLIVDNTFATPYLFRPFDYGANIVVHSATKYIGGHGTTIGGLIVDGGNFNWGNGRYPEFTTPDPSSANQVFWDRWGNDPVLGNVAYINKCRLHYMRDMGAALSPFNAFLLLQGLETLSYRMEKQTSNALRIAEYLEKHPDVAWVSYPGLPSSPYYRQAKKYFPKGASGILSFGVKGGFEKAASFVESTSLFSFLANVGDSRSLIVHPATVTHGQLTEEQRRGAGIRPEQIRLSAGTEDIDDLLWDLEETFKKVFHHNG
ncbi:MAG: O-acetylhomoserine aminocarboxypropyltransferase/cysteine synthase [Mediterranea sp.]|jgi:O-acetylhomoserine (thiol)-lyase|nr:O-acetylhomoserine aminocarboxypropyltransferase/cysteine synthase [Mediterranea sp.]